MFNRKIKLLKEILTFFSKNFSCIRQHNLSFDDLNKSIFMNEINLSKRSTVYRRNCIKKYFEKNNKGYPLVSILMPTMREDCFPNIVENISCQLYENLELILIPQWLTSGQIETCRNLILNNCHNIKNVEFLMLPDEMTLGERLNIAIDYSNGEYWAKMDDDDLYFSNYLIDMFLNFQLDNYAVVGKGEQFVFLKEVDSLILKRPLQRHRFSFVSGATFMVSKSEGNVLRFGPQNLGEDTWLLRQAKEMNLKVFASDPFNHVLIRNSDLNDHTWKEPVESFMKSGPIVSNFLNKKLVEV